MISTKANKYETLTFASSAKAKSVNSCSNCKKSHRKCYTDKGTGCERCTKLDIPCSLSSSKTSNVSSLSSSESIYAKVLLQNTNRSQYITSTQPLAPILSKDSILCLDGEILGLFCPWRDIHFNNHNDVNNSTIDFQSMDPDLREFLDKKRAFELPSITVQSKLLKLFMENIYPFYPILDKHTRLQDIPLLLLNAIMLCAMRYTAKIDLIRTTADELRSKCKYLEMVETNKLTLIQSYLLLSIHEEGPDGALNSREYITKSVMFCIELGLHNLEQATLDPEPNKDVETFRLKYDKSLLLRIFWVSFCCDRYISVTSGSAMIYNKLDLLIEEPTLEDFDGCEEDFTVFTKWISLCTLFERLLTTIYRPPSKRTDDDYIERDIFNWAQDNDLDELKIEERFKETLRLVFYYCNVLLLRCRVGVLNLIELTDIEPIDQVHDESMTPLSFAGMKYIQHFTTKILALLNKQIKHPYFEHIIMIHSLLHVLVFTHLEIQMKNEVSIKNDELKKVLLFKNAQLNDGLKLLKSFKSKWWLSGAAYELFKVLLSDQLYKGDSLHSFQQIYSQITGTGAPLTNEMFEHFTDHSSST